MSAGQANMVLCVRRRGDYILVHCPKMLGPEIRDALRAALRAVEGDQNLPVIFTLQVPGCTG